MALRHGIANSEELPRMWRWPGTSQARRAVTFLDARSESAGESVSRVRLHQDRLPAPELQQDIFGPTGRFLARVDFYWDEERTIGEFDVKFKYGRLRRPGESMEDVIFAEKVREDALQDLGWQIVRGSGPTSTAPAWSAIRSCGHFARSA